MQAPAGGAGGDGMMPNTFSASKHSFQKSHSAGSDDESPHAAGSSSRHRRSRQRKHENKSAGGHELSNQAGTLSEFDNMNSAMDFLTV